MKEAIPYAEAVVRYHRTSLLANVMQGDIGLYLCAALSVQPGREDDTFRELYKLIKDQDIWKSEMWQLEIWARAHFSRMCRRAGSVVFAEEQEKAIGQVIFCN